MRKSSKKQIASNRANAAKSTGPKSADGKKKSRQNALKNGFFSTDVVAKAAGERAEDFQKFKEWVWDSVQPDDALDEILTNDVVENWWRRQRVRRGESADLQNRLENRQARDFYLPSDEIEPMKLRFEHWLERYKAMTASIPSGEAYEIVAELENVRSQLASTPVGLDYLIKKVQWVKTGAESTGQMSPTSESTLAGCAGLTNDHVFYCRGINLVIKRQATKAAERAQTGQRAGPVQPGATESEKAKDNPSEGKEENAEWDVMEIQDVLVSMIEQIAGELSLRKQLFKQVEDSQARTRWAAAVLPDDHTYARFERAETTYDRRLYRAMDALQARKLARDVSKILPGVRKTVKSRGKRDAQ